MVNGLLAQPSASDDPDLLQLLRTAHHHAFRLAKFDTLEQALQLFVTNHFASLIQQGCTPAEIGTLLPSPDETRSVLVHLTSSRIRDDAFGKLVAGLGLLLRDARDTKAADTSRNVDPTTASRLVSILEIEASSTPDLSHLSYDSVPLFEHIEEQKRHGALIDDPAWEFDYSLSKNRQWVPAVQKSVASVRQAFLDASNAIDWVGAVDVGGDIDLLTSADQAFVAGLLVQHAPIKRSESKPVSQPKGADQGEAEPETGLSAKELISIGSACRAQLIAACREQANVRFKQQRFHEAEELYRVIDAAANGDRDPSVLLNRAAALLKLDRFNETIAACSQALELLTAESDAKGRNLAWKGYVRRGRARKGLADRSDPARAKDLLSLTKSDFEEALKIDPNDAAAKSELDALEERNSETQSGDGGATASASAPAAAAATVSSETTTPKAREKTILESPFFRSDLVTGLLADTLRSPAFPLSAVVKLLSLAPPSDGPGAGAEEHEEACILDHGSVLTTVTPEQQAQLRESIKHVGAVLALPQYQSQPPMLASTAEGKSWRLVTTSLRLLLGCCALLVNEVVKAQSALELVSTALRPDVKKQRGRVAAAVAKDQETKQDASAGAEADGADVADVAELDGLLDEVRGHALRTLERCCRLQGKRQEGDKFQRWSVQWRQQRGGDGDDDKAREPDTMAWFVRLVQRLNEQGQMRS
ncbi:hypothetical protein ACQY0O_000957 [Thecaphora frezii]